MTVRLTNLTGKDLYYKVLDYEGPFANFDEQNLPGQYPGGQEYTDFGVYNAKMGNQRHTLSSRYPRYNGGTKYLPGDGGYFQSNFSQQPSHKSYEELQFQFPSQRLNGRMLDGNQEGVIPKGLHRDLMLKDINCNLKLRAFGKPTVTNVINPDKYVQNNGAPVTEISDVIEYDDPRLQDYEGIIKVARLRETNVLVSIAQGETFFMYDSYGVRIKLNTGLDTTNIALYPPGTRQLSMGVSPSPHGTYVDSLRRNHISRFLKYRSTHPDMTATNYSNNYDLPDLGYFDRRWLPGPRLP